MSGPGLRARSVAGGFWMIMTRMAQRGVGLISTLVLARLLLPADFGLFMMAVGVVGFLEVISNFSFDIALIRNQSAGRAEYDTAWTLNVAKGATVAMLTLAAAYPAAAFFGEPRILDLMPWIALCTLLEGFNNIGIADFRKHFRFNREFWFLTSGKLAAFFVTVAFAVIWRNYYALVAGMIARHLVQLALSYAMHPYRPRPSLAAWRDLFRFSKWLMLTNALGAVNEKIDVFVLGRLVGPASVGIYRVSGEIASLTTTELIWPIMRALFPAYSKIAHDLSKLRAAYLEVQGMVLLLAFPLAAGIGGTAVWSVPLLLGPNWLDAIPLVQALSWFGLLRICTGSEGAILLALGRSHLQTLIATTQTLVLIPAFTAGALHAGAQGGAWSMVLLGATTLVVSQTIITRVLELPTLRFIGVSWRPVLAVAAMTLVLFELSTLWTGHATRDLALHLAGAVAVGALTYVGVCGALWLLSGRPAGAEQLLIRYGLQILERLRPPRSRLSEG